MFLLAIFRLSEVLKDAFSERAKRIISSSTSNLFSAILIGAVLTMALGSSSAVIIIAIIFINAQNLTFRQAMGIIMGANIGTTLSSQIIALSISEYAYIPLIVGLLIHIFSGKSRWRLAGDVIMYFGMLFFGLFLMESSVMPLRESQVFSQWIERIEGNPFQGALIGGFITLIIQSSSGTVGMAIVLGKQQLLSAAGGIAIMLGAELGTCSDTLIATIRGSRQAIKAGLFHLFFNLSTIILGLILFIPFVNLVDWLTESEDLGRIIANAHMLFNFCGVLVFLPFVSLTERALNRLLPEKEA